MVLVDTSLWVDHLRAGSPALVAALQADQVCTHAYVIGELACGNLENRQEVLGLFQALPRLTAATDDELLFFIEKHRLMGRGIGYIDAHLLAAAAINVARLWTRDKRLKAIAEEMNLAHLPEIH